MSKGAKIAIIFGIIGILIVAGIVGVISLINKEKTSITASQFKTTMERKGIYSIRCKFTIFTIQLC